jgi:hypothetical protein
MIANPQTAIIDIAETTDIRGNVPPFSVNTLLDERGMSAATRVHTLQLKKIVSVRQIRPDISPTMRNVRREMVMAAPQISRSKSRDEGATPLRERRRNVVKNGKMISQGGMGIAKKPNDELS